MYRIKKLVSLSILALMLVGVTPSNALAVTAQTTLLSANTTTAVFNPGSGQQAVVNYSVLGPGMAIGVLARVYTAVPTNSLSGGCGNSTNSNFIANLEGPVNRPVGNYSVSWTGKTLSGGSYPAGLYCYQVSWDNPPAGATALITGLFTLSTQQGDTGSSSGSGTGTGQSGSNTDPGATSGTSTQYDLTHWSVPATVHLNRTTGRPDSNEDSIVYIHYTVHRRILSGLSLVIRDSSNITVNTLVADNGPIGVGDYQATWNVAYRNGNTVPTGYYRYQFISNQQDLQGGDGRITVEYATEPQQPQQPQEPQQPTAEFVQGTPVANPVTFNPDLGQSTIITYTLGKPVTNFRLSVTNQNGTFSEIADSASVKNAGTYSVRWYGQGAGADLYVFKFQATNEATVYRGNVRVTRTPPPPPPVGPFLAGASAYPTAFVPGVGQTTITYTLARSVTQFRLDIRNQSGVTVATSQQASLNSGTYNFVWNGVSGLNSAVPGLYTFVFQASNENPVTSGSVTIATAPQNAPVITDLGPNPTQLQPSSGTTFSYLLTQDSYVDLTILNGNVTVRRLLVSGSQYNGFAAGANNYVNTKFWDGKNNDGYLVGSGIYTYTIEARNTNGTAVSRSGSLTVLPVSNQLLTVSNLSSDPTTFNPDLYNNNSSNLRFTLNRDALVTVTVTRQSDGVFIRTLATAQPFSTGPQYVPWNGADQNGILVPNGRYNFRVLATDTRGSQYGEASATGTVSVNRAHADPLPPSLDVSNASADPNPFNADTQNTQLRFSLNQDAYVTITVTRASDSVFIKTLTSNQYFYTGSNSVTWGGTDQNGSIVPYGVYNFRVDANNSQYGNDSVTGNVTVNRNGGNNCYGSNCSGTLQITYSEANPVSFNPNTEKTNIDFTTNVTPSTVTARIYRNNDNTFIKELAIYTRGTNTYRAEWNGKDSNNYVVPNDTYTYRIDASYAGQTTQRSGPVFVVNTRVSVEGNCGGFPDVPAGSSLCTAVEFVKTRGIFTGYGDGTLQLGRTIERAELLAVVQRAFKFPLETYSASIDGDLGYPDLRNKKTAWYMPYIKTFDKVDVMTGYPQDHTMRPEQVMNAAELYKVFLRAAKATPYNIAHFTLSKTVKIAPYDDTPVSRTAQWFLRYAEFAKVNGIVTTDNFYPGRGITRGQVIKLIYDTYRKGLITYDLTATDYNYNYNNNNLTIPAINDYGPNPAQFIACQYASTTLQSSVTTCGTTLRYSVSQAARVNVTISKDGSTIRNLVVSGGSNNNLATTQYSVFWDGMNSSGYRVNDGVYTYNISAQNSYGTALVKTGTVLVGTTYSTILSVSNLSADPYSFNPATYGGTRTTLRFTLNQGAYVTITITRPSDGTYIKTLVSNFSFSSGANYAYWDGTDQSGNYVPSGTYNFRVDATSSQYGNSNQTAYVVVTR